LGNLSLIESPTSHKHHWLDRYSKLNENNNDDDTTTKTMQISLKTYNKLQRFSRKQHSEDYPLSYDEIIESLVSFWNEKHDTKISYFQNT
jgi:hypothetical protein